MEKIKLPSRNDDQPLIVYARFYTNNPAILHLVRDYVTAWTKANATWTRIWRSNVITEERLNFYSQFLSEPRIEDEDEKSFFSIVLEVQPRATRWKDWAVFLVNDISKVFREVKFDKFETKA
jgi:hypothetical protein